MNISAAYLPAQTAFRVRLVGYGAQSPPTAYLSCSKLSYESSDEKQDEVYVLGGCIATAESWTEFAKEWERLVRWGGTISKTNTHHFKMKEMAENADRMSKVPIFFRTIEKHILGFVWASIKARDLKRALNRIFVPNVQIDWAKYNNPWYVTYRLLMDVFHVSRDRLDEFVSAGQKIDFYFDNRAEKKAVIASWEDYINTRPQNIQNYYGATPRFEDDQDFLPLQAADFWAWWVRKWRLEGKDHAEIDACDFGSFKRSEERSYISALEYQWAKTN